MTRDQRIRKQKDDIENRCNLLEQALVQAAREQGGVAAEGTIAGARERGRIIAGWKERAQERGGIRVKVMRGVYALAHK
jgi:hypothetical protein